MLKNDMKKELAIRRRGKEERRKVNKQRKAIIRERIRKKKRKTTKN